MRQDTLYRFFGGSPGRVLLRLVFISFVVGIILSAIDLNPLELINWARDIVVRIWNMGFEAIERVGGYFLLGAIIVFPLWLLSRFLKMGRGEQ
ncbi:DUF6460 domain-containing protein [Breoghania sp. L-A4]|uniref:DUF6460 domain-containing protein n=1 Tax=Breoghania sp. L-A4 TaxID=2304600 RepID=UPI000E360AE4|nr:DUF6460 domain-containing protein [Breoghania sp. L-A4]AXS39646.1 integrase [Breoghania sp. L-A4]